MGCASGTLAARPHPCEGTVAPKKVVPFEGVVPAGTSQIAIAKLSLEEAEDTEGHVLDVQTNKGSPSRSKQPRKGVVGHRHSSKQNPPSRRSSKQSICEPINPEAEHFLDKVLRKHFLFSGLEQHERSSLINYMTPQSHEASEVVFKQGDPGSSLYVIQRGSFIVAIDNHELKQLRPNHTFGELALLYNTNRTATVTCDSAGSLWRLDERAFRACMKTLRSRHFERVQGFLGTDPNFKTLSEDERALLATQCSLQQFKKGHQILREGDVTDWMFVVVEGCVATVDQYGNMCVTHKGAILGSTGLMFSKRQIFGATALDNVTCIALGKTQVERMLGPIEQVLRRGAVKSMLAGDRADAPSFFRSLSEEQSTVFVDNLEEVIFDDGDVVVSIGAKTQFALIMEGEVAMLPEENPACIGGSGASEHARQYAKEVLTAGMSFGAKEILQDSAMTGTVLALSRVRLLRIGRERVSAALGDSLNVVLRLNEIRKVLSGVFLFKNLQQEHVDRVIRSMETTRYAAGDTIVRHGEEAQHFFLIQSGVILVKKDGQTIRTLSRWDYFGERALLLKEKRSATCEAEGSCTCLVLEARVFGEIVGNFRYDLEYRMSLQDLDITLSDLRLKAVVGRGTFGVVKAVHHRDDQSKLYALKCVRKEQVVKLQQQKAIVVEREVNAQCYHPCIAHFIRTFQDADNVYFLTEFLGGGDLFYAMREIGNLTTEQTQFFGASIVFGLGYLHGRSIMYRDLKPENVLLDLEGRAKLVDFGCCKKALRTQSLVGTPEYLAPEVILGKDYTSAVDWWSLGVMIHEFIVGPLPFGRRGDQLELFRQILEAPLVIPSYVTDKAGKSLIADLLERTPELRLGSSVRGWLEIQDHKYFLDFSWAALAGHCMKPPWKPNAEKLTSTWEEHDDDFSLSDWDAACAMGPDNEDPQMAWAVVF